MKATLAPVLAVLLVSVSGFPQEQHAVAPRGEYAKIDVQLANQAIAALQGGSDAERARAIEAVLAAPQRYAPAVFYVLSQALFAQDRKDDAAFWFYAGQLRARYDANRCADVSARQAVAVLNQEYGTPINKYMFKDFAKLEALIPKVVDWDRKTPHDYDHRWINLHGMAAMIESLDSTAGKPQPLSLPRAQWNAIAEKTRTEYVAGFRQAAAKMKERAAAAPAPTVRAEPGWEQRLRGSWKQELSSVLARFPKDLPGAEPGEAGRRAAAERFRMEWTITSDTITIVNPMAEPSRRVPPYRYRMVKVEGNVATLEFTPPEGPVFEWDLEYLEADLLRVLHESNEVYRLARVTPAAKP